MTASTPLKRARNCRSVASASEANHFEINRCRRGRAEEPELPIRATTVRGGAHFECRMNFPFSADSTVNAYVLAASTTSATKWKHEHRNDMS